MAALEPVVDEVEADEEDDDNDDRRRSSIAAGGISPPEIEISTELLLPNPFCLLLSRIELNREDVIILVVVLTLEGLVDNPPPPPPPPIPPEVIGKEI